MRCGLRACTGGDTVASGEKSPCTGQQLGPPWVPAGARAKSSVTRETAETAFACNPQNTQKTPLRNASTVTRWRAALFPWRVSTVYRPELGESLCVGCWTLAHMGNRLGSLSTQAKAWAHKEKSEHTTAKEERSVSTQEHIGSEEPASQRPFSASFPS